MNSIVDRVDFGRLDAESDQNLNHYFLDTGTVAAIERGATMVIGRKGSGKTALFRHLPTQLAGTEVIQLDLDEYVWEYHKGFRQAGIGGPQAFSASWKLFIYVAVYGRLRERLTKDERSHIEDALGKLGVASTSGFLRAMFEWVGRFQRVDLPSVDGVFDGGGFEVAANDEGPFSGAVVIEIERIGNILAGVSTRIPFCVLIDRLDDAWDRSQESLDLIGGAVRATRDLGLHFGQSRPAPVITFLRSDLWERLSYNDRNKMSQDTIYLDWSVAELTDVIDLRIATTADVQRNVGWQALFSGDEMRQRASAQTYISKRVMGRPRDIVAFCIFALDVARSHKHEQILPADIYEAERRYSRHVLDELKDELDKHVPDFGRMVAALKALRARNFTMPKWLEVAKGQGIGESDARAMLDQLIDASVVGVRATGGSGGGSGTVFRYSDRHLQSTEDGTMQVHLGFTRELGLKDA